MKNDCLFCKIVKKEIPSNILFENDDIMVILDAFPNTDGHTLVIPKKHYEDIYEVPNDVLQMMYEKGKIIAKELMDKLDKPSLSFLINYGDAQAIKHIHLHLLPDYLHTSHKYTKEEVFDLLKKGE